MRHHFVLRIVAKLLIPLILLFGLYVQFHGDFGPGGGFQAGVIFGAGFILYALVFGVETARKVAQPRIMRVMVAAGLLLFGSVGLVCQSRSFLMAWFGLYNYWVVIFLMMAGFYVVIVRGNVVKKIVGLNLFQTSVFILYISMSKVQGGTAPIVEKEFTVYSNPLPHVLILTAIVVGVATTALALALAVRIKESYGTVEEDEIHRLDKSF